MHAPRLLTPSVRACHVTARPCDLRPSGSSSRAEASREQGSEGARLEAAGTGAFSYNDFLGAQ